MWKTVLLQSCPHYFMQLKTENDVESSKIEKQGCSLLYETVFSPNPISLCILLSLSSLRLNFLPVMWNGPNPVTTSWPLSSGAN